MTPEPLRPRVGLLALTLELYEELSPELRPGREEWVRREVLPALEPAGEVIFSGAVYTRAGIEAAVAGFQADGADALLVMLLTYSPSQLALPALRRARVPIVIWNTQELAAAGEDFTGAAMIENHGVHGTQDLANVLLRSGVPFEYVTGHPEDADAVAMLGDFFAAAAALRRLRGARIGLIGYPFPGMGDFALDTTQMAATFGCEWLAMTVGECNERAEGADRDEVASLVEDYRASYDVADDVTEEDLAAAARMEAALRGLVGEHGLSALAYQFMAFGRDERTPTLPFVAASRLMAEGIGFGGEGDLIAAAGSALLNWLRPPASFSEMFTIDFGGGGVVLSHMGEANVAMARQDRPVPLVVRARRLAPTRARQLALVTAFEPGPATLCALTPGRGGRWRLVVASGAMADWGPLPGMEVPHAKFLPQGDVREFLTGYARAGGPHHLAVCFGDARARLRVAARLLDADYREV